MKASCVKEKLEAALRKVERVITKNVNLPVLSHVFFETKRGQLSLKATNLDVGVSISIPAKVQNEGVLVVPGAPLASYVAGLHPSQGVILEETQSNLTVRSKEGVILLKALNQEDFPILPTVAEGKNLTISPTEFIRGLEAVSYSASLSGVKPELSSIFVVLEGEELITAATDSFRLSEKRLTVKHSRESTSFLLPLRNVSDIIRIFQGEGEDLMALRISKNQLALSTSNLYVTSRLLDGVFPDYRQIIPNEEKTTATILKEDLLHTLRLVHLFADRFNHISFHITPSKRRFEVRAKHPDFGEATHILPATVKGEDIEMSFNYRYIAECLPAIESESVTLSLSGASRPAVIRGMGDHSFMYLVMPMNR